jgi:hypothetical protein
MFDDVLGAKLIERIVGEWKAAFVEIAEYIGGGRCVHVQPDGTGIFRRAAADVQNARQIILQDRVRNDFRRKNSCTK